MIKKAYQLGVQIALEEAGLTKEAIYGQHGAMARLGSKLQDLVYDPRTWATGALAVPAYYGGKGLTRGLRALLESAQDERDLKVRTALMPLLGAAGAGVGALAGGEEHRGAGAAIGGAAGLSLGALAPYADPGPRV